jgi:hypothetical protein
MHRGETLDEFLDWVCDTRESVRKVRETLALERKWGVASVCWEARLQKLQEEFEKLRFEVSRCVATRDANRLLFDAAEEGRRLPGPRLAGRAYPKSKVVPLARASVRTPAP